MSIKGQGEELLEWRATALFQQGGSKMDNEIGYIHHVGHVVRDIGGRVLADRKTTISSL